MEKSVGFEFDSYMQEVFQMKEVDVHSYSPLTLAYIGDSIYDLIIKSLVINQGNRQVNKLHKETSMYVQASTQSLMMRAMQEELTEEEHAVYKRGRNAKSVSPAKNQSITDYRNRIRGVARISVFEKRMETNVGFGENRSGQFERKRSVGGLYERRDKGRKFDG